MTPRQNAIEIIRFGQPEYVMEGPPTHGTTYFGCNHESFDGGGHHLPVGSQWTDIWGTTWHREHEGVMGFPRGNPLADLPSALRTYRWPNPTDDRLVGMIYEKARGWNRDEAFLSGQHRDTLWEKCYMLVGMDNAMCYLYTEPQAMREILHRIMDFQLGIAEHYLKLGVEMVSLGDDLGTQSGLLLSPQLLNDFFLPEYRRLFGLYRKRGVIIGFHSCGHVTPLLETFMDLGVDVLNPVQATANDLAEFRRVTQGRMALQGGVSSRTLVEGPVDAIRAEVAQRLWQLGRNGGYFCSPDQGMPWPPAHFEAMRQAVRDLGRYPIAGPAR